MNDVIEDADAPRHREDVPRQVGAAEGPPRESDRQDVMAITNVGEDAVSVTIEEVKPDDWAEKVYKPDIVNGPGKHYKKPGYNPLR